MENLSDCAFNENTARLHVHKEDVWAVAYNRNSYLSLLRMTLVVILH